MKKLITILIFLSLTLVGFGQLLAPKGIKIGTGAAAQTAYNLTSQADYVIDKVGSTYYARPGISTGYTAYSGGTASTVIISAMGQLVTGGTIYLNFALGDNLDFIIVPYSNITLKGRGKYLTKLKLKASADVGLTGFYGLIDISNVDNFTISDIELDGNGVNQTIIDNGASETAVLNGIIAVSMIGGSSDNVIIENCYIHDFTQFGVYLSTAKNAITKYCYLKDNYWNNITYSAGVSKSLVFKCYAEGSADVSITIMGDDNTIEGCFVNNMGGVHGSMNSAWGLGVEGTGSDRPKIINNKVTGANLLEGIYFNSSSTVDFVVENNEVYDLSVANGIALRVTDGSYGLILSNKFTRIDNDAIRLTNCNYCLISGNDLTPITNWGSGIRLGTTCTYNKVFNNNIEAYQGFVIGAGCDNNTFIGNTIKTAAVVRDIADSGANNVFQNTYSIFTLSWISDRGTRSITATATADGLTTGIILPGSQNLTVTSNTNDVYIISLPAASAATIGTKITGLLVGAKICELRVQAAQATTVYINGITTNVEAALPAACSFEVVQVDATHWILTAKTALGAVITAIVPDAV